MQTRPRRWRDGTSSRYAAGGGLVDAGRARGTPTKPASSLPTQPTTSRTSRSRCDGPAATDRRRSARIGQDTLAIRGDQIEFTIPAPLPDTFRGKIEVLGLPALKPRVGPCPVDSCSVRVILDASDVMLLPARIE